MLLAQLVKDQEAVDQVREIVEAEEAVMKKETQVVQDYADVRIYIFFYQLDLPPTLFSNLKAHL